MTNIDQLYERLGITSLQADVLVALMENGGSASVPDIIATLAVNQKVNRTSIYSVLKKLGNINLVLASEHQDSRNITYTLVSKSPQELVNMLIEPNIVAVNDLTQKLQEAKLIASKSEIETEFYSLKNVKQIRKQIQTVIHEADDYILIMANSLMLKLLYPTIQEKINTSPNVDILIQPTWNPDQNLDFEELLEDYKSLIGHDYVSNPLTVFSSIAEFSRPLFIEFSKSAEKGGLDMVSIIGKTNFVQVLTDQGMIISTYFDHELLLSQAGTGLFSQEQFISQNYIIIYFSIFQAHHDKFNQELMERVIIKRMKTSFATIQSMLMN